MPRTPPTQIYEHPWYNKNLPPGVKEMNDHPQPLPVGLQSQEEIQRIVAVSWLVAAALGGSAAQCGRSDRHRTAMTAAILKLVCRQFSTCQLATVLRHGCMFDVTAALSLSAHHAVPCCPLLQESRHAGAGTYAGLQETDDYIDDAMDSYEASLEYQD